MKLGLLMVTAADTVSHFSGTSTLTLLLCWKVFINLFLKAESLLTECSIHTTAPWAATPTPVKTSSNSRCSLGFQISGFIINHFQDSLTISSAGNSSVYQKTMAYTFCAQKEFQHETREKILFPPSSSPLLPPFSRHGDEDKQGQEGEGE